MITKEPYDKQHFQSNTLFTKSARSAFLHILRKLRDENQVLLLPAYIGMNKYEGSGVFDVVGISRIPFEFYTINEQFEPELESIKLKKDQNYCLLLIHYFGFPPSNFEQIISFCEDNTITLIEDCAHTLDGHFDEKKLGSFGSYSFHSIHKVLATDDGGILVNNTQNSSFQFSVEDEGIKKETIALFAFAQMELISKKRRDNYNMYLDLLEKNSAYDCVYPSLNKGIVPLNFPILVKEGKREKLYFELEKAGILTCALYYKMIPEIERGDYPMAHTLSASILNLPVHQDTSLSDIQLICETLNKLVKTL